MNKYCVIALATFISIFLSMKPEIIQAQGTCDFTSDLRIDKNGTPLAPGQEGGATITSEVLVGTGYPVKNVVVFAQDPDEEGAGIDVSVTSINGYVLHDESITDCVRVDLAKDEKPEGGGWGGECQPPSGTVHYYSHTHCDRIASAATRYIKRVLIWLQPSTQTAQWLGWGTSEKSIRSPLRFLFPEKWMAGTWTPDGFEVTQSSDVDDSTYDQDYYQAWWEQLQDYNFLAGDSNEISKLWSVTLVEVKSPADGTADSLGIFGNFLQGPQNTSVLPENFQDGELNISYGWEKGGMNYYKKVHTTEAVSSPISNEMLPANLEFLPITMRHIPMDLPGMWTVGVMVEMTAAHFVYGGIDRWEVPSGDDWNGENPPSKWFDPTKTGYNLGAEGHSFYSFVILSTPCNPMELNSCFDYEDT